MPILADARRNGITHLHANFGSSPATVAWLGKKILGTGMSVTYHAFDIYQENLSARDPLKKRKLRDADLVVAVHEDGRDYLRRLVPDIGPDKFRVIRISVVFEPEDKQEVPQAPPLPRSSASPLRPGHRPAMSAIRPGARTLYRTGSLFPP